MPTLQNKVISGVFWSLLQKVGGRGISFVIMVLLARILTPKDFGLIGLLIVFIDISQVVIEGGFNLALIQKKDTDEEDYSSVFYINLIISILFYIILFLSAPYIASFYHQPLLTKLTRAFSIVFIINAFSYVQEARLTKNVRFKTLTIIHIPSTVMGGIVSIFMAFNGFGVWSIVILQVVTRLAYTIQIWIYARWMPLFSFKLNKAKALFSFGGKLLVSNLINSVYNNLFLVVIGKFYSIASVGYYQNASNIAYIPSGTLTSVLSSVSFPIFSSIQDDDKKLKEGYKKVMLQAFFWVCPAYILASVLATPLFSFIFSDKWIAAVPFFQLLCIGAILQPLYIYNLNILNVKGKSDIFLKLETIRRIVTIIALIAVFPLGIWGLLVIQATGEVFTYLLFAHFSGKNIAYTLREQIKDLTPILLSSLSSGILVFIIFHFLPALPNWLELSLGFSVGIIAYGLLAKSLRISAYTDFSEIIKERLLRPFLVKKNN